MNSKTLLFGIGNCGRKDDGLGWAFLDSIKPHLPDNYDIEYRYQLQIEDAELATKYQTVIFIDAHHKLFEKGFIWQSCYPKATDSFTTHELDPPSVLYLVESIYNKKPKAYILGISGFKYDLELGITKKAASHLEHAIQFFTHKILSPIEKSIN